MTLLACIIAAAPALAQGVRLDVQANVSNESLLHFEGTVTPHNLVPEGQLQVRNEVDVFVEAIGTGGRFRQLPDRYHPAADESYHRGRLLEGEELEGRESVQTEISGQALQPADDGERFGIVGTVQLGEAVQFRIVARLRHTWVGSWPAAEYCYDVAGPFEVKPGIARKRRGGGFFGEVGRFLERAGKEIGDVAVDAGKVVLLGGGGSPVGILQALLLGDLQQRGGALGQAVRLIGGAGGAGATLQGLERVLSGDLSVDTDDITRTLVESLLVRHTRDGTVPAIVLDAGAGRGLPEGHPEADALIGAAAGWVQRELSESLGLREVRVDVDSTRAIVASQMPGLQGRGHLEPIIAYMLVDAALAAPWTEMVTAVFDDGSGDAFGLTVPAAAARTFARGNLDTESFLQLCRFADPAEIAAAMDLGGPVRPPTSEPEQPVAAVQEPATAPLPREMTETTAPLLDQSRLPAGWLASTTYRVSLSDLDRVIPGMALSEQPVQSAAIQVLQVEGSAVTLLGLDMADDEAAAQLTVALAHEPGGEWHGDVLRLSTEPVLHALHHDSRAYLLQGEGRALNAVVRLVVSDASAGSAAAGLAALMPAITADDRSSEVSTTGDPLPEAVSPPRGSYLSTSYLCTGAEGSRPLKLEGALPEGAERLGVYIDVRSAPANTVLRMELWREGTSLGHRLVSVNGDRRAITYFMLDSGFSTGRWWIEVTADDQLLARLPFTVK